MRLIGFLRSRPLALNSAIVATAMLIALPVSAQQDNLYRAEIVLVERIIAPDKVEEKMANRHPDPVPKLEEQLWVVSEDGARETTLDLLPRDKMNLASAAKRLEQSGNYRVLMTAAWQQSYPPDYEGSRLQVAAGDWLPEAGQRAVEGYIKIDRVRFLHVNATLNHWQPGSVEPDAQMALIPEPVNDEVDADADGTGENVTADSAADLAQTSGALEGREPLELITWIRETRRMRSEEIHFMDSPTIGVLIYFEPIEAEAAPES
ncbi:MAG: 5'-methylthioadenosine phosphorylase [Oleiphilaceae bacterium]|nr:5'-methylthioadenosine phosphorylase [Oleiphilaceae bacterium]